jgi:hypothetical protein
LIYAPPGANTALIKGSVDDVRIYTRALTGAEIQALYNSEK